MAYLVLGTFRNFVFNVISTHDLLSHWILTICFSETDCLDTRLSGLNKGIILLDSNSNLLYNLSCSDFILRTFHHKTTGDSFERVLPKGKWMRMRPHMHFISGSRIILTL